MDFKKFDQRNYPIVSAREGYGEWAETYETAVPTQLDIRIFERIRSVGWTGSRACLDLACGTGRIGELLKRKGVGVIDGIDITPEMLALAEAKDLYRSLSCGSIEKTGLSDGAYDLIVMSLVDEHLASLEPVYREAARVSDKNAKFVVVGMHPFFFMTGMPTHFKDKNGASKAIETHIHLTSDHVRAALGSGWTLQEMHEGVVDEEWLRVKPKWEKFAGHPVNYGYVWGRERS